MKKNYIVVLIAAMLLPMLAGAQVLKGSYFLDHSVNNHKLNPAFAPRSSYFQLIGLGYTGMGVYSNVDIPLLMQPVDGGVGTFLHPSVSVKDFESRLPNHLHMDTEMETVLLSFGGFTKKKSFWNFNVDMKTMVDVDLPSDLLLFLKKGTGTQSQSFNIGNVNAYAASNLGVSFGYSREWFKGFRGGFKVRGIAPLMYAGLNLDEVSLTTGTDKWAVNTEGYLYTAMQGLQLNQSEPDAAPSVGFNLGGLMANKAVAGWGYSVDLGAEYVLELGCPVDGMSFSLALTDLGQIFYNKNAVSAFENHGHIEWTGFQVDENMNINTEQAVGDISEKAAGLLNLNPKNQTGPLMRSTMPRLYVGVEYPFLKRSMSVGLLYSARFSHSYARHEMTVSYNITPCKWFALGVNYSFLNTPRSMGAILEFTPKVGPCLFLGMDYIPMEWVNAPILENLLGESPGIMNMVGVKTSSWALPTSSRFNMNFGIAFNVGSKHVNPKKEKSKKTNKEKTNKQWQRKY